MIMRMARPSAQRKRRDHEQRRVEEIIARLAEHYPSATCALNHNNAYQLLVATILSAQCTDERVNQVTPQLFEKYPDAAALARASEPELQEMIRSTGFFRNKARSLIGAAREIEESFRGEVPREMDQLLKLPGVARKTANVVLGTAFGIPAGVVVDTHVRRLSNRLGLSDSQDPARIEEDLMREVPQDEWIDFAHRLILHGRQICKAKKPQCEQCFLADLCPYYQDLR